MKPLEKLRRTVQDISLALKTDASAYYKLLGDDVLEGLDEGFNSRQKDLWLNLGYWKDAHTYPEACTALARKLAEWAQFEVDSVILDAGFGYGEQDLLWAREYDFEKIYGVNVTPLHVKHGRMRIAAHGLESQVDLRLASATELPIDDASVDRVVALESAFHFNTRQKFLEEAWRVLKPGGRLAVADMLPLPGSKTNRLRQKMKRRRFSIPDANMYDIGEYVARLLRLGFDDVVSESIAHYVYPGMYAYTEGRFMMGETRESARVTLSEEDVEACRGAERWGQLLGLDDYVLVSAVKPR